MLRYRDAVKVYVVEDRVEGPVRAHVLAPYPLLNDKLLERLRIVLLDLAEGTWCFRGELGKRERGAGGLKATAAAPARIARTSLVRTAASRKTKQQF
jgi:hypothetical protein